MVACAWLITGKAISVTVQIALKNSAVVSSALAL